MANEPPERPSDEQPEWWRALSHEVPPARPVDPLTDPIESLGPGPNRDPEPDMAAGPEPDPEPGLALETGPVAAGPAVGSRPMRVERAPDGPEPKASAPGSVEPADAEATAALPGPGVPAAPPAPDTPPTPESSADRPKPADRPPKAPRQQSPPAPRSWPGADRPPRRPVREVVGDRAVDVGLLLLALGVVYLVYLALTR